MHTTTPSRSFTIPSLHDSTPLDCRIYSPCPAGSQRAGPGCIAVLAHPYAPLGGSYDDAVVLALTDTLRALGLTVGTFNFR